MTVFLSLEASQPCGKTYRLGFGCNLHLASMLANTVVLKRRALSETRVPFFTWTLPVSSRISYVRGASC